MIPINPNIAALPVTDLTPAVTISSAGGTSATGALETPFSSLLTKALDRMGELERDASTKADGLLRGDGVDVHAAMISTERADLAFELALAVRNKAVAAYQQLNSLQF